METLNKLTFNFNLREPRAQKATPLYLVVKLGDKQIKMPIGIKVLPFVWSKRKQECIITPTLSDAEREKTMNYNSIICNVKTQCYEIINYLCRERVDNIEAFVKNTIKIESMANHNAIPPKRTITATKLIKRAFDIRYPNTTKASTLATAKYRLKAFLDYIKICQKGDTPQNHLTQEGLNDYKEFLQKDGNKSIKVINEYCQLIERLINVVLCVNSEFRKYKFSLVKYVTIKDNRTKKDSKKVALTNEEIDAIKSVQGLTEKEQEYRDLFIMQLETGVRYSDLSKLFNGEYKTTTKDTQTIYTIDTQKEGITAAVVVTPTILAIQEKYKNGFKYNNFSLENNKQYFNYNLKAIAKKAQLNRVVEYVDGRGVKKADMLCEIISNHYARHTFITMKLRDGYTPAEVSKMSGHADTRMIEDVYEHLNEEDKALQVIDAVKRNANKKSNDNNDNNDTTNNALIAQQARENFALKVENEISDFMSKANGKLYHLGFNIKMPNGYGLIHKTSTPSEANALLLKGFPNENERAKIMDGARVIDVVNERLQPLGVKYNKDYRLVKI